MAIRENILTSATARDKYIQGVKLLKNEFPGPTTASLGIGGLSQPVSTYDLFVVWHHVAMTTFTPPTQSDRNAAHRGPVFLPWHRFMLMQLEMNLQRVLGDDLTFWIAILGLGARRSIVTGTSEEGRRLGQQLHGRQRGSGNYRPVRVESGDPDSWRVHITTNVNGQLIQVNRGFAGNWARRRPACRKKRIRRPPLISPSMTLLHGAPLPPVFATSSKAGKTSRKFHPRVCTTVSMCSLEEICRLPRHPTIRCFISTTAM